MQITLENGETIETDKPLHKFAKYTALHHNTDFHQVTRAILAINWWYIKYFDIPRETVFELLGLMADLRAFKGEEAGFVFATICKHIEINGMTEKDFKATFLKLLERYVAGRIINEVKQIV